MGMLKQKKSENEMHLSGSDGQPAINGGYLYIYLGDDLLTIASIPSPNLMAENNSQSTVENYDEFTDQDSREYSISIFSSMYGINWQLDNYPDDENVIKKIHYEVKYNEY